MEFETEEQQVEAIKKWIKEYASTILIGLILGLASIYGYRYFISERATNMAETSDAYESVLAILTKQNDNEKFIAEAATFNISHADTVYSNFLSFQLAKLAVNADDSMTAVQHLRDILNNPQHATIEHIARIRIARLLISQQKYEQALALIAEATGDQFRGAYEMLRGDIWFARGDRNRARQSYEAAKSHTTDGPSNPNLDMLLTDLANETAIVDVVE